MNFIWYWKEIFTKDEVVVCIFTYKLYNFDKSMFNRIKN